MESEKTIAESTKGVSAEEDSAAAAAAETVTAEGGAPAEAVAEGVQTEAAPAEAVAESVQAEAAAESAQTEAAPAKAVAESARTEAAVESAPAEAAAADAPAEESQEAPTPTESMADYEAEIEASFKRVREGDILTGTVIGVDEEKVTLDLKYYAEGIIKKEDLSNDPDFQLKEEVQIGDEVTATVVKTDDGEGNILLSRKEANDLLAWDKLKKMLEERTIVKVKIAEIVKSGAVAYLEGIRGFIPASKLAAGYVEDLSEWDGKTLEVTVITADEENKRLVLSGREVAREKLADEKRKKVAKCQVGAVVEGTVETLKDYGAFVVLENGLTGLLHISQISTQRIKHPGVVLKEGQTVKVKILSTDNGKISLSMRALEGADAPAEEVFDYKESGAATTGLGALLKGIKLN